MFFAMSSISPVPHSFAIITAPAIVFCYNKVRNYQ
jgi:hypothetical protein